MGLHASIYKNKGQDFSAKGISSRANEVTVVNASGPFDPSDNAPAVLLIVGPGRHKGGSPNIIAVPAVKTTKGWEELKNSGASRMCGGTFVSTSDDRLAELIHKLGGVGSIVSFHDRFERFGS